MWGYGEGGGAVDGVADVGVVVAVVAEFGLDGGPYEGAGVGWDGGYGEGSPVGFVLGQPVAFAHAGHLGSGYEGGFLRVEAELLEAAAGAVQEEARGGVAGEHRGAAVGQQAWVMEGDVEGVFDVGLVAVAADAGGDGFGGTEEGEGLIDEMGAEVHEEAVGVVAGLLPGGLAGQGAEAVEVRLVGDEAAELASVEDFADGEEVAVPAAVVEGGEDEVAGSGEVAEFLGLGAGGGEGLVDDDVLAGEEGLFCEVEVGLVGGGDDDELDGWVAEGLFDGAEDAGGGVGFGGLVAACAGRWPRASGRGLR